MKNLLQLLLALSYLTIHTAIANDFGIGVTTEKGYVHRSADEMGGGAYRYNGLYLEAGKHSFHLGILKDSDPCNVRHQRAAYSRFFKDERSGFLWGLELITLDRDDKKSCTFPGAVISIPIPYLGYSKPVYSNIVDIDVSAKLYLNRVGAQLSIGF